MAIDQKMHSIESDLGKALSGKKAYDIVEANAPREKYTIEVLEML